jgi:ATP adenylyltransferase
MQYVSRPDKEAGCFLCAAAVSTDDEGSLVVWRSTTCFALLNRYPYNNGHMMVAPAEHVAEVEDVEPDQLAEQLGLLKRCKRVLTEVMHPNGFNVGLNLGSAAGAGVPGHMHWHIVPRWQGDTNFMPVVAQTKVIPQALGELWHALRKADPDG